jgi:PqqD family protein of HPr-rel-A system
LQARALRWRTVSAEALAWHDFDGEIALRNARTGSTHLLDRDATEVLRTLIEGQAALSAHDIAERLDADECTTEIEAVLSELQRLELVEPASP